MSRKGRNGTGPRGEHTHAQRFRKPSILIPNSILLSGGRYLDDCALTHDDSCFGWK
jgi:hypothetical protein